MNADQIIAAFETLPEQDQSRVAKSIAKIRHENFVLSRFPVMVKVGNVRGWLQLPDVAENKKKLIEFIGLRLTRRYLQPLKSVPEGSKSGFLIMAAVCLLIETLQQFYAGRDKTKGDHAEAFNRFFVLENALFPDCANNSKAFYERIRCGLLHQAETTGGYRILFKSGPLFDAKERTVNATEFLNRMELCIGNYLTHLQNSSQVDERWLNAQKKIKYICDNCQANEA